MHDHILLLLFITYYQFTYTEYSSYSHWLHLCLDHLAPSLSVKTGMDTVFSLPSQAHLLAAFPLTRLHLFIMNPSQSVLLQVSESNKQ